MKKRRITACCAAFIAAAMLMTGCNNGTEGADSSNNGGDTTAADIKVSDTAREIADEYFPRTVDDYTTWRGIDRDKVIAYVDGDVEDKEFFDIPFGEFFNEYMYYIVSYQIDDDMSEENKATCEGYRDNIISYIAFERMYRYVADKEYGISEATLSADQLKEIRDSADEVWANWAANFYASVSEKLGEDASEEDKNAMCSEVLQLILEKCGLNKDIFYTWELSRYIQDLVIAKLTDSVEEVTEDEVRKMLEEFISEAKDKAENAPDEYESLSAYPMVYIPEGTRVADQIFVSFSEDDLTKIAQAINDGDDAETEKLVEAAYTDEIKAAVGEISAKLADGADFADVKAEYDASASTEMIVLPNSPSFFEEYRSALYALENKGDVSEPVVYSNGIYFIRYADDAQVLEAETEQIKDSMRSYLASYKEQAAQNTAYTDWMKRFNYTVDYETIHVDAEGSVLSNVTTE